MKRYVITTILVTLAAPLAAQPAVECKKTETQAECHARLQCHADEELDACQKRLRAGGGGQSGNGNGNGNGSSNGSGNTRGDDGGDRRSRRRDDRYDNGDDGGGRRQRGRRASRRRSGGRSSSFEANKTFGLGLELGEPTGLNGKYFLSDTRALDFGVGYIYDHYYYGDGFHLYVDHLWHPAVLASSPALELPFYIGVGARFWNFDYCEIVGGREVCFGGSAFGVRVPIGISFDFNNAPIDIFLQLVPTIDLIYGDYYDRFNDRNHFGIDGNVGIRFWFR